jgi:hypothetical protein
MVGWRMGSPSGGALSSFEEIFAVFLEVTALEMDSHVYMLRLVQWRALMRNTGLLCLSPVHNVEDVGVRPFEMGGKAF